MNQEIQATLAKINDLLLFQLVPSALPTEEIASGLLPTPQAFDATGTMLKGKEYNGQTAHAEKLGQAINRRGRTTGLKLHSDFVAFMMGYPIDWLDLP